MTRKDKLIAGVSFISLLVVMFMLFFGSVALLVISMWFMPIFGICLSLITFGGLLWLPKYMRTWQDWANNVKKFIKVS